jgi:hypothetical protein
LELAFVQGAVNRVEEHKEPFSVLLSQLVDRRCSVSEVVNGDRLLVEG